MRRFDPVEILDSFGEDLHDPTNQTIADLGCAVMSLMASGKQVYLKGPKPRARLVRWFVRAACQLYDLRDDLLVDESSHGYRRAEVVEVPWPQVGLVNHQLFLGGHVLPLDGVSMSLHREHLGRSAFSAQFRGGSAPQIREAMEVSMTILLGLDQLDGRPEGW